MTRRGVAGVRLCHAAPCKYPAGQCPLHGMPRVGDYLHVNAHQSDTQYNGIIRNHLACDGCGYLECFCPLTTPEPKSRPHYQPKDVLPEGWTRIGQYYRHKSGAQATPNMAGEWVSARRGAMEYDYDTRFATRELAMAAALQSVEPLGRLNDAQRSAGLELPPKPAEPALRPGWESDGTYAFNYVELDVRVFRSGTVNWVARPLNGFWFAPESGLPTLEDAMIRAEQLARGEP